MFGIIIFMVACVLMACCVASAAAYKDNSDIEMEEEVIYNPMTGAFEWEPLVK